MNGNETTDINEPNVGAATGQPGFYVCERPWCHEAGGLTTDDFELFTGNPDHMTHERPVANVSLNSVEEADCGSLEVRVHQFGDGPLGVIVYNHRPDSDGDDRVMHVATATPQQARILAQALLLAASEAEEAPRPRVTALTVEELDSERYVDHEAIGGILHELGQPDVADPDSDDSERWRVYAERYLDIGIAVGAAVQHAVAAGQPLPRQADYDRLVRAAART